ncbi:hypothetical protein LT85_0977 [Collimonas arenae]|uniref:Uncharacterized protein n=1 Tax=Collimonas arenae TaxID=279058 RepID=A0A0A1F8P1_9BURK|nr:hypothetical protein [Collimonas arenae]AIY40135.1 hypothetical protein LT85_0977 [Collimonas arenae]
MALKSDDKGFLQGEPVQWARALKLWTEIRNEVHSLRESLSTAAVQTRITAKKNDVAVKNVIATPKSKAATVNAERATRLRVTPATPAKRGANGRFLPANAKVSKPEEKTKKENSPNKKKVASEPQEDDEELDIRNPLKKAMGAVHGVVGAAVVKAPDVAPAIAAAKELHSIVAPLGRGWAKLFGKGADDKKVVWYKRLWNELRGLRQEDSAYHLAEARRAGENKHKDSAGEKSGGILSMLGGLFTKIPGLGALGGLLKGGDGLLGGLLRGGGRLMGGLGKGLFRRIPLIGAAFAGISAATSAFGPDDPDKTPEENRKGRFTGVGSGVGALIGGGIGTLLGGPIGTVIGGMVGDKVGELVGAWLSTLDWEKIGAQITGAWDTSVAFIKDSWKAATDKLSDISKTVGAAWDSVINGAKAFLKSKLGIDVNATVAKVKEVAAVTVEKTKAVVAPIIDKAKAAVAPVVEDVKKGAAVVGDAVKTGASAAGGYVKGRAEKMASPIVRLVKAVGMTRIFEHQDGSVEQRDGGTAAWRNNNPGNLKFEYAGSADKTVKTKRTKEAALAAAQKRYGTGIVDLDQWGNAVFDSAESGRDAQAQLLKSSHGKKTIEEMLPKYAISDYSGKADVKAYADRIYKTADAKGLDLRGKKIGDLSSDEMNMLLDGMGKMEGFKVGKVSTIQAADKDKLAALAGGGATAVASSAVGGINIAPASQIPSSVQSASIIPTMPNVTSISAVPAIPDAPTVQSVQRFGSSKPLVVQVAGSNDTVGQDLSDRRIAHIATGGMSGGIGVNL